MNFRRIAVSLVLVLAVSAVPLLGCLQGFGVQRGTGPDGRPTVELCAELARAQPSASAPSVAAASASAPAAPVASAPPAPSGELHHAK